MVELEPNPEEVFKPGNLAWGTSCITQNGWQSILEKGILRPKESLVEYWGFTPDSICLTLLQDEPIRFRHFAAAYYGPLSYPEGLAIIVDKEKLLRFHPGQLVAVAENFTSSDYARRAFHFDKSTNTVFGIPLRAAVYEDVWDSEVRLGEIKTDTQRLGEIPRIAVACWTGIIINPEMLSPITDWTRQTKRKLEVPIFDPSGNLLSRVVL